jgi:branched-chain amino acid transport system permease protein
MTELAETPSAPMPSLTTRFEIVPIVLFAAFAAAPLFAMVSGAEGYVLSLLTRVMIFGIAAMALDLILGYGALVSFGHAAFLGLGAYAVGILASHGIEDVLVQIPVALAASALFALVTGAISLRTKGVYFIMITLAFGQMAFFTAASLSGYGGDDGYTLYGRSTVAGARWMQDRLGFHYLCLGLLVAVFLGIRMLLASRFGRVLRAVRENPLRVEAVGLSPYPYRLLAYTIAGGIAGLAGFLLANATEFVAPSFLAWQRSGDLLFMVILGGLGSPFGAVLGALVILLLEEWLGHLTPHWRLIFGPLLVLSVLYLRGGLVGLIGARRG